MACNVMSISPAANSANRGLALLQLALTLLRISSAVGRFFLAVEFASEFTIGDFIETTDVLPRPPVSSSGYAFATMTAIWPLFKCRRAAQCAAITEYVKANQSFHGLAGLKRL